MRDQFCIKLVFGSFLLSNEKELNSARIKDDQKAAFSIKDFIIGSLIGYLPSYDQ